MLRLVCTVALAGLLAACADPDDRNTPVPVENTTYRIGSPKVIDGSDLTVDILDDRRRCQQVFTNPDKFDDRFASHDDRLDMCVPKVDRASGQVQLSFRLSEIERKNRQLLLPLEREHLQVLHNEREVTSVELFQYNPSKAGQLFLILIDSSGSMEITDTEGVSRTQRVKNAIWANRETFINDNAAVAMFRFTDKMMGLGLEAYPDVNVIDKRNAFKAELDLMDRKAAGWTHLYRAVSTAVGPLLDRETAVKSYLNNHDMQPTIVLLTDGFNNTRGDETCGDNASQLAETLQALKTARRKPLAVRPTLYTVGFGVGFRPGWEPPADDISVSPGKLCGKFQHNRIDGGLDKARIDNVSLKWLASAGGGVSFIKSDHRELERVFAETAPTRYTWYQVRYRVDPFYHRSSFVTRLRISQLAQADASVAFHPSAWFDAPSGTLPEGEDRWVKTGDIRRATAFAVPMLGLLVLLTFLGPALFNGRRALFRRARKSSK